MPQWGSILTLGPVGTHLSVLTPVLNSIQKVCFKVLSYLALGMANEKTERHQLWLEIDCYLSGDEQHTSLKDTPRTLSTEGSSSISLAHKSGL
jgi:hypothetical protein